jgi:hypothetical protein
MTARGWSRVLRYAAEYKHLDESLRHFIKRKGGINRGALRFARRLGRGSASGSSYWARPAACEHIRLADEQLGTHPHLNDERRKWIGCPSQSGQVDWGFRLREARNKALTLPAIPNIYFSYELRRSGEADARRAHYATLFHQRLHFT